MSYLSGLDGEGLTKEQTKALLDFDPKEVSDLDIEKRVELALRHREIKAQESQAFWAAIQAVAIVMVPLAALLGISKILWRKGK